MTILAEGVSSEGEEWNVQLYQYKPATIVVAEFSAFQRYFMYHFIEGEKQGRSLDFVNDIINQHAVEAQSMKLKVRLPNIVDKQANATNMQYGT